MNALDDFRKAMERAGLSPPALIPPGEFIRFPGIEKSNGNTSGWAKLFEDGEGGIFGDWSSGMSESWQAQRATPRTKRDQAAFQQRVAEQRRIREEEDAQRQDRAAEYAQTLLNFALPAASDHPYLRRKGIQAHGLQVDDENRLIVPLWIKNVLTSVLFIPPDGGEKRFLTDGETKGGLFTLGDLNEGSTTILIAEGFATAASLYEATGFPTVCAFSAGNLVPVAQALRQQCPSAAIVLCADNDVRDDGKPNVGLEAATKAAQSIGGLVAVPEAINNRKTDWNDIHVERGLDAVREAIQAAITPPMTILDEVFKFLGRFVAYPSIHSHIAHTLWIAHTHFMDLWESTPRLAFLSPESGSGKTRALELTETLVPRPVEAVNVTSAYLFRKISDEKGLPTVLHDEIDTIFGPRAKEHEEIRGVINAGHRRGASAGRCVLKGKLIVTEELSAYCAVAMAGLGNLPDTILSRCVIIRMQRKAPEELVEPYRRRVHAPEGYRLRDKLAVWATQISQTIDLYPVMPPGVTDRNADVWESLLSIADAVSGNVAVVAESEKTKNGRSWPQMARVAAVAHVAVAGGRPASLGLQLLADLRIAFGDSIQISTDNLVSSLLVMEESPWGDLKGKPLDARRMAGLLRPYGIQSRSLRVGGQILRGYARQDFYDAWLRYLPSSPIAAATTATTATEPIPTGENVAVEGYQAPLPIPTPASTDEQSDQEEAIQDDA